MATKIWVGTDSGNEGDWATAANWSPSGVPESADNVYLVNSSQGVTEGFAQSAVALASLNIAQSFTGQIGDADNYLAIGSAIVRIGYNDSAGLPTGSNRIKLDLGSTTAPAVVVENTSGSSADTDLPPVNILAVNAAATLEVRKGKVGVALGAAEVSTFLKITSSYVTQKASDADVYIGNGVTLTNVDIKGGDVALASAASGTINAYAGTLKTTGSGTIATINALGSTITPNSTGTITALTISGGKVDFTGSSQARTVTTLKLEAGGQLVYDPNVLTVTNKVDSDNPVTLIASAA